MKMGLVVHVFGITLTGNIFLMFLYNKIKLFFVIYDKPAFNTLFSFKE